MTKRHDRRLPTALLSSLPALMILMVVLQIAIGLIIYAIVNNHTTSFGLWSLTVIAAAVIMLFLVLPRLKRDQQAFAAVIAERTAELINANTQLAQEIEERKSIEAALRLREATLEKVQRLAHIGDWEADLAAHTITWSEELYRIHGRDLSLPSPLPEESFTYIHPDDLAIHQTQIAAKVFAGEPFATDIRIIRSDGDVRYVEARGEPVFDQHGQMVRYLGMSRDLTERKLTEDILRKSEALLREAQATASLGCWEHDLISNRTMWTEELYRLHGRNPELPPPTSEELIHQVIYPEDLPFYREHLVHRFETGQPFACDFRIIRADQAIRWVTAKGQPVANQQGEIVRYIGVVMDISDRKNTELELQTAKEAAEAANRAKSIFLSSMSHELRTPLNAILGFAQLLSRDTSSIAEQKEYIDIINWNGQHLLELINDVLELSKIESGKVTLHPTEVDLYQLLGSLQDLFQPKAKAKDLTLRFERSPTVPQLILADESKLRQILINLLSNAIKFTATGGVQLRVKLQEPAGQATATPPATMLGFAVQDSGPGIAPAERSQLFRPFSQTTTGRQTSEGTGLGLAISRNFVELMQGEIGVDSQPGVGSTFWFTVPAQVVKGDRTTRSFATQRVIGLAPEQPRYRILVIEDHPENAEFLTKTLTLVGFEVQQAANGQAGLTLWQTWQPHLILMDMQMPVMDGYETTQTIRALEQARKVNDSIRAEWDDGMTREWNDRLSSLAQLPPTPTPPTLIIAVTGSAFEEDRTQILGAGCDDFIRKPLQENLLFDQLAYHLGVQYCYEDPPLLPPSEPLPSLILSPADLKIMPETWIRQLNEVAKECSEAKVLQLLSQISEQHPDVALALVQLATNFRFEAIVALTQQE